tara:strand:- start:1027 stop:1677 length:651 start_codon:yes stop_codon:yes gene_type:complete
MNILHLYNEIYTQINKYMDIGSFQNFSICMFLQNSDKILSREYKKNFLKIKEKIIRNSFHEYILNSFDIENMLMFPIRIFSFHNITPNNIQENSKLKIFFDINNYTNNYNYFDLNDNYSYLRITIMLAPQFFNRNVIEIYAQKFNNRKDMHYTESLNGEIKDIENRGFLVFNHNKLGPLKNLKYLIKNNFEYNNLNVSYHKKLFLLSPLDRYFSLM